MPSLVFAIPKHVERLVQLAFEHKGLFGNPGGLSVPLCLSKGPSRRFQGSGEGVGFTVPRMSTHVSQAWTCLALNTVGGLDFRRSLFALSRRIHAH